MSAICLYFQVHQPFRLRTYRFFDIGDNHYYYDDFQNRSIVKRVATRCYLPANKLMLELIERHGKQFKVSFSISGNAIDQFEMYAPEVIESFKALARTGCVEFLAETYSHNLSSLRSQEEFTRQVELHQNKMEKLFGTRPTAFRNTELIYSDTIGAVVAGMGFDVMLTEGAKHILGWKSPNLMYCNSVNPKLKVLMRNFQLSEDIAFRFSNKGWSEWPLTADKFAGWVNALDPKHEVLNLFMDYETFGEHQWADTGIFDFLRALPTIILKKTKYRFHTPTELAKKLQPVSSVQVPYPMSWADAERDITSWTGNDLQSDAFDSLYSIEQKVKHCTDPELLRDWNYLQTSDHFFYMSTKWFSDGEIRKTFNHYPTPYEAYINYMNVISDFILRVDKACPQTSETIVLSSNQPKTEKKSAPLVEEKPKKAAKKKEAAEKKPTTKASKKK
ncbi:MAG: polysaccharide deacetylase family protein [Bacteroidales bacterium]|nr:polysaccharide deacetylase family protein [Bacteroidales bacterium]